MESFFTNEELALSETFLRNGYAILPVENIDNLNAIKSSVVSLCCDFLQIDKPHDPNNFLENASEFISTDNLNPLRLYIFNKLNSEKSLRPSYFSLAKNSLYSLIGNELAMQNKVNLSIQMPNETSSVLDIHSDVFAGESPFQLNQWTPLVNVSKSSSMFILPRYKSDSVVNNISKINESGFNSLFEIYKNDLVWLDVPYESVLIFDSNCLHGNIKNSEEWTRWSFNCRYKSLLSPYFSFEKKLGSFYTPITIRPATRIGMSYSNPTGFSE